MLDRIMSVRDHVTAQAANLKDIATGPLDRWRNVLATMGAITDPNPNGTEAEFDALFMGDHWDGASPPNYTAPELDADDLDAIEHARNGFAQAVAKAAQPESHRWDTTCGNPACDCTEAA